MKTSIDLLRFKIGMAIAFRNNKTITATEAMIAKHTREIRCEHCGLSPIHYMDNCGCKKRK